MFTSVQNLCIRFFKLFEQSLLLFCFEMHNSFKQFVFVCAV